MKTIWIVVIALILTAATTLYALARKKKGAPILPAVNSKPRNNPEKEFPVTYGNTEPNKNVMQVQQKINMLLSQATRPPFKPQLIEEDGLFGPETREAIIAQGWEPMANSIDKEGFEIIMNA